MPPFSDSLKNPKGGTGSHLIYLVPSDTTILGVTFFHIDKFCRICYFDRGD